MIRFNTPSIKKEVYEPQKANAFKKQKAPAEKQKM